MSSIYDNTVFDFDLDFLNQPATNNAEPDLQARADRLRKSILFLKRRVKYVDGYVSAFYAADKKVEEYKVIETQLKDQCKQHHVEIGSFIEKLTRLENEIQVAEARERQKDEKISDLENQIVALQMLQTQLKLLEIEKNKTERTPVKVVRKSGKCVNTNNNTNKGLLEVETLRKENEKLHKENVRIPSLEKEIESLRKKNALSKSEKINDNTSMIASIQKLEKEIERLSKENAKISQLEKEVEILIKKNGELYKLEKDNENLQNENAKIPKLTEEIEKLQKENAKITKLTKEVEILRVENAKITNLRKENENILKQNVEISNLQKEIETLRDKNEKFEMENIALRKEIIKISNKEEDTETRLTHIKSTTKETGKLQQKNNKLTRKYKSLPDDNSEWWDHSEAKNGVFEDPVRSPTPNDTIVENSTTADKEIEVRRESDNDYSNEVASVDTGRGSSLANSDSDKGLNSPEYVLNYIPPNENSIENKDKSKDATMSSNSILLEEKHTSTITTVGHDKNQNVCKPKRVSHRKSHTKLLSSVNQTNAIKEVYKSVDTSKNVSVKKQVQSEREKECLEINNSLQCDSHTDLELGHIFNTMKLNYKAVSPIPRTPVRMYEVDSTFSSSELKRKKDRCNILCKEAGVFLMQLSLRLDVDPNSVTINDCDKLIACFDSILKSKQVLTDCSIPNINSNMEISDCVMSHDDHNLVSISYPESITSLSEKETEQLQNNKGENRLSQNESWSTVQDENQNRMLRYDKNSMIIKNSSPPDVNRHKQKEKELQCLARSMDESQIFNHSVSEESAMENKISEVTDSIRPDDQSPIENSSEKKAKKMKITKLGKLKKKLEPKYKIRIEKTPPRKLSNKLKQLFHTKKMVTGNETSASLNQKDVYEKAVKVMAEINSQQNAKAKSTPNHTKPLMSPKRTDGLEKDINSNDDNQLIKNCSTTTKRKLSELFDTCTVVLIKDPLLFSPIKTKNSMNHKAAEDNNSTAVRVTEDKKIVTQTSQESKTDDSTTDRIIVDINSTSHTHCETQANNSTTHKTKEVNNTMTQQTKEDNSSESLKEVETQDNETCNETLSRKRRRRSSNEPLIQYKRVLRSATVNTRLSTEDNIELSKSTGETNTKSIIGPLANENDTQLNTENTHECLQHDQHNNSVVSYGDLDAFSENLQNEKASVRGENTEATTCHPKESILCYMLEKYGVETVRPHEKKIPDNIVKQICEKLEQDITIIAETKDNKNAMNNFVEDLRKLNYKHFVAGLVKFLAKPERKDELFGKVNLHPAPPMTKAEQILLFAIHQLETYWPSVDIVDAILSSIEFSLFKLNRTPDFGVVESTSHFYAVLCRYVKAKSRLRLFMLDAMYCIQFKSVPLIKQCLEVWMHIIPLSHLGMAKTPLVTCLVYLLHFYKCEDKFNRVNEIRKILREKYYYQITDWNETRILEMFKNSIKDLKDISIEKKMLRLALIILAKRQGPQWCQNNIIKNLLQPMIEKENVRKNVKEFCVSMIGPLMKPYPVDMKVHCEIAINQLMDILDRNPSPEMEEAAITSMMFINRHDQRSINKTLLSRKMKPLSLALEKAIRDYVKTKPLRVWKNNLSTMAR